MRNHSLSDIINNPSDRVILLKYLIRLTLDGEGITVLTGRAQRNSLDPVAPCSTDGQSMAVRIEMTQSNQQAGMVLGPTHSEHANLRKHMISNTQRYQLDLL